ncbi:MAG TPA: ABC transporter permease, partial [Longimicrobiales bacterium]|nr:ABC transporter permease [Longimicrobiales bacterium]
MTAARWALLLLPRDLRHRIGPDVLDTVAERAARADGPWDRTFLAAHEVGGVVRTAVRARRPDAWTRRTAPDRAREASTSFLDRTMDHLRADVAFALRTLARRPALMGLAALSLALGIGASTAMFGVVDSVLLRPLSFDEPEELVSIYPTNPEFRGHPTMGEFADRGTFSLPEVFWLAENQTTLEAFGAYIDYSGATLSGDDGPPERIEILRATPGLLPALGVGPVRGRLLSGDDDPRDGARSVLLTEAFWSARFGSDPEVVGSTVRLNDESWTVVGILPDRVEDATSTVDAWVLMTGTSSEGNWGNHNVSGALGRLAQGVDPGTARAELERLLGSVPAEGAHDHGASVFASLQDRTRTVRPALLVLIGAAFLLLVVGCGNVAALLLGAGIEREREIAVRGALGAGRGRLTRQLLTESLVLAGLGAAGGLLLTALITEGLLFLAPPGIPRIADAALDGRV